MTEASSASSGKRLERSPYFVHCDKVCAAGTRPTPALRQICRVIRIGVGIRIGVRVGVGVGVGGAVSVSVSVSVSTISPVSSDLSPQAQGQK